MMKSRFFPRKDEVVLSIFTALIVVGLSYQGFSSLLTGKEHAIFKKEHVGGSKK